MLEKNKRTLPSYLQGLIPFFVIIFLSWPAFLSVKDAVDRAFWFEATGDEIYHSEGIEVLSQKGKYEFWNGAGYFASTGPAHIAPSALISRWTGLPGVVSGRIFSLFIYFCTLFFVGLLALRQVENRNLDRMQRVLLSLGAIGLYHLVYRGIRDGGYYSFGVMGEGTGVCFLLAACLALDSRKYFWVGASAALSFLAKPFFGLILVAAVVTLFWDAKGRFSLKTGLSFATGFILPFCLAFLLMAAGSGFAKTYELWVHYPKRQVSLAPVDQVAKSVLSSGRLLASAGEHLRRLPEILKWRSIVLCMLGLLFGLKARFDRKIVFLNTLALIHLAWWIFFSPWVESRYLLPATIACAVLWVLGAFAWMVSWNGLRLSKLHRGLGAVVLTGMVAYHFGPASLRWKNFVQNPQQGDFGRQVKIQKFWRSLPVRPVVWSNTVNGDSDLLVSAPYQLDRFSISDNAKIPPGSWIAWGIHPHPELKSWLARRECKPIFLVPGRDEGIYQCP